MITLIGFGSEGVFAHVLEKLVPRGDVAVLDLESFIYDPDSRVGYDGRDLLITGAVNFVLPKGAPIYHRIFLRKEYTTAADERLRSFYNAFVAYSLDQTPGTLLINYPLASAANSSKPAQVRLLSLYGFRTPDTLVSTDREALRAFCKRHREPISKGISGFRTIAGRLADDEVFAAPSQPIMLQEYVAGFDVRLHCIGLDKVGLRIRTDFVDYRYAERFGYSIEIEPIDIPYDIAERCWAYMRAERQEFAAFDFRVNDAKWYLLEVNPMPGFSFFDKRCGGQISDCLWQLLLQGYSNLFRPERDRVFIPMDRRPKIDIGTPR